jgi:hypothetical protein
MRRLFLGIFFAVAVAGWAAPVDFHKDIEPILKARCQGCHGASQQMNGLRLDSRDAALTVIVPGKSSDSVLIHRVTGDKGLRAMPPGPNRLTAGEINSLRTWIDEGATWPDAMVAGPVKSTHWAFQPIRRESVPKTSNDAWVRNPIDGFVLARLDKEKIQPSPEASKRVLLRRLSLDLTGLPPTPQELADFEADTRPDAYERQVDRLLASEHFGEKWGRHWLDRARYADSDGYEKDWTRPFAWRYRDYVINAFYADLPFDRFTIEQIAGDLLPNATVEQRVATGFHRNTLTNREGGIDNKQFIFENALDRSNTVATAWLGLTTGCAQCHNHKYDPISQKEHYELMAFFDNVEEVDIDAPLSGELGPFLAKRNEYRAKREALLNEYKIPEQQAAWEQNMLRAEANPGKETDWDLAWDCLLKLTESGADGQKLMHIPLAQRTERQRDILTDHFVRNYFFAIGDKKYTELGFKELDKKLRALKDSYPQLTQAMTVVEAPGQHHSFIRVKGDYKALGAEVQPDVLAVLPPLKAADGKRATRLDLAKWMVAPENPLTARVAVNWMWQEVFGQAIVRTPNDFGTRGEPPSHPELLDWLASSFRDNGWSVKLIVRTMVTSNTYRQSSKARPELQTSDPANILLARQNRMRLPAELIRDEALAVSGLLNTDIGGKSVFPPQPAGVAELGYGQKDDTSWKESTGRDKYRRGMYIFLKRSTPYPMLLNFDAPKSVQAVCRRDRSDTALQALNLLNDPVFMEAADALAYETLSQSAGPFRDRLAAAFERALGRAPSEREIDGLEKYFAREKSIIDRDPNAAPQRFTLLPQNVQPVEMAAWVAVSSVLLNLDEFITRE